MKLVLETWILDIARISQNSSEVESFPALFPMCSARIHSLLHRKRRAI
jgi:hypothetical protein